MILYAICLSHSKWAPYIAAQKSIPGEYLGKVFRESWSIVVFTLTQMNKSYRSGQWNWQQMGSIWPASWYCTACEKASIPKMFVQFSSCLERLERCWCFDFYLESAWFKSWLQHRLSWQIFIIFLCFSKQILGEYLKSGHYCCLPHPFLFIIHFSLYRF